jgi:hypothetical protein
MRYKVFVFAWAYLSEHTFASYDEAERFFSAASDRLEAEVVVFMGDQLINSWRKP